MATATKRTWKLQEFVAHATNVNCLALGRKSGRVMVTGGEDKKVNMWAVGKPNCIMSLSGHTTPVECVRFGLAEEMVVAGSMSGALKIWDLEAAKIIRTLTGHKAGIKSLVFHPYGDFVASGSLDTNTKLWDIRRKGCIYTYKGHTNTVNSLNFSPDGRWIVSASEDGCIKLWDLTAGKLLNDFKDHIGPVTDVEFHPNEFLLASGSADRTVKFWDLETFQLVSSTDSDSLGAVRSILFNPDGSCLYSAASDTLRVYGWEPARCYDALHIGWSKVADITVAQTQLIGAAFSQTNVSIYVVDLKRVQPLGGTPTQHYIQNAYNLPSPPHTANSRKNFNTERPPTQSSKQTKMKTEPEEEPTTPQIDPGDDSTSLADIKDPEDYREIFQPRSRTGLDPPTQFNSTHSINHHKESVNHSPPRSIDPFPAPLEDDMKSPDRPFPSHLIAADRGMPVSLNMEEFLPRKLQDTHIRQQETDMSESEAVSSILKGHDSMLTVLTNRHRNLHIVHAVWANKDLKGAVDTAVEMGDLSTLVDLLNVLSLKPSLWSLDLCISFLPSIEKMLASKYETYVHTGCSVLKLILKNFAPVIKANISSQPSIGIDISREERYNKCKDCFERLMTIRNFIMKKQNAKGKVGSTFRELMLLLHSLE